MEVAKEGQAPCCPAQLWPLAPPSALALPRGVAADILARVVASGDALAALRLTCRAARAAADGAARRLRVGARHQTYGAAATLPAARLAPAAPRLTSLRALELACLEGADSLPQLAAALPALGSTLEVLIIDQITLFNSPRRSSPDPLECPAAARIAVALPAARRLRRLELRAPLPGMGRVLAAAAALPALGALALPRGPPHEAGATAGAYTVAELRVATRGSRHLTAFAAGALVSARLPALATLHTNPEDAPRLLAAARWALRLRRLVLDRDAGGAGFNVMDQLLLAPGSTALRALRCGGGGGGALRELSLRGARLGAPQVSDLAAAPLQGLTRLDLGGSRFGAAGVEALVAAPWAAGLRELGLAGCGAGAAALAALAAAALPALRALNVSAPPAGEGGAWLAPLAAAPWAPHLTRLDVSDSGRALGAAAADGAWAALAAAPLAALRRFRAERAGLRGAGAAALAAAAWLGGLERLELGAVPWEARCELRRSEAFKRLELSGRVVWEGV
ncbi:MAG: hypothetical protein J3K34DRAFT_524051 [Monoraphidium minutum]|nr:MAG: hypothetical protein J3K34DRAFT_524051 [Monoraphidium minutum]